MHVILHVIVCNAVCNEWCNAVCNESYYIAYYMPLHEILHACYMTLKFWEVLHVMACNWHVITCHYMHYMPLHAIEDANDHDSDGVPLQCSTPLIRVEIQVMYNFYQLRLEPSSGWCTLNPPASHILGRLPLVPAGDTGTIPRIWCGLSTTSRLAVKTEQ